MAISASVDPNTPIQIYALIDPRDEKVRYVGWTSNSLERRLSNHLSNARKGVRNHRCNWLRQLLSNELIPIIYPIEESVYKEREEKEKFWIGFYGRENLTNSTDGGEGSLGLQVSEETRKRIAEKVKGRKHSDETKEKIGFAQLGSKNHRYGKLGTNSDSFGTKYATSKSSLLGVTWDTETNKWRTFIHLNSKRTSLGRYAKEESSAIAYDMGIIYFYGSDCELNFSELKDDYISYLKQYDISNIKELRKVIKNYISEGSN